MRTAVWCIVIGSVCFMGVLAQTQAQEEASYVGDSSCLLQCHGKQVESFNKNTHNNAFSIIKDTESYLALKKEGKEKGCLRCHATGYGNKGGFFSEESTPEHAKVGCEGCHGPASAHVAVKADDKAEKKATIQRKPDCGKCHLIHAHTSED